MKNHIYGYIRAWAKSRANFLVFLSYFMVK